MVLTSSLMARMSGVTSVSKRVRATISSDEGHAGGGDVDGLAGLPLVAVGGGDSDYLVGVGGDALAVEGGCDDAALADVERFFGGDEAFAEEELHAADGALFAVAVGVVDEDVVGCSGGR